MGGPVLCSNQRLILCGVHASSASTYVITLFAVTEKMFAFFSCSTHGWEVLTSHMKLQWSV